jgi:hypothetical protein
MAKRATNAVLARVQTLEAEIELLLSAAKETHHSEGFTNPARNSLTTKLVDMQKMLEQVVREIDPVQLPLSFFDPTEPSLIGRFISIALVARHLIGLFRPLWNNETRILFGIGKHGDSSETRANNKSPWDTLHPGRQWALGNPEAISREEIITRVARHFETASIFRTVDSVLEAFLNELRRTNDLAPPSDIDQPEPLEFE